jgi:hypothetical protein
VGRERAAHRLRHRPHALSLTRIGSAQAGVFLIASALNIVAAVMASVVRLAM